MFRAYVVEKKEDSYIGNVIEKSFDALPNNGLMVKVFYSSLNYKDALSAIGAKGVTRQYPHTPGIDAVGEVHECKDGKFKKGDHVIVTGHDLGMDTSGGFAEFICVPSEWAIPLPKELSMYEAMCLGTAGLTAAIGIDLLEQKNGLTDKKAIINGATGGVGYIAVNILSQLGVLVTAVTGKKSNAENDLRYLGASEVISREEMNSFARYPLSKGIWDIGYDIVGGDMLTDMLTFMKVGGSIACCGNVRGADFSTSVFPFILRGNSLLGVDSQGISLEKRNSLWQKLATDWKPDGIEKFSKVINLSGLNEEIALILKGKQSGRIVVSLDKVE